MRQRGRPTKEAVAVVVAGNFGARPEAPDDLTEDEQAIWRETAACEPTDFIATAATKAMLKDYCRHRAAAEKITRIINLFQDDWLRVADGAKRYKDLLRLRDQEARAAGDKATRLRMTNQSRYTATAAGTASRNTAKGLKPWETLGD